MTEKIKAFFKAYCPKVSAVLFAFGGLAVLIHIACIISADFSDLFNRHISSLFRGAMGIATSLLPFSLAETVIVFLPLWLILMLVMGIRATSRGAGKGVRYIFGLSSFLAILYALFVFTSVAGYNGRSLAYKLGLSEEPVTTEELLSATAYINEKITEELDDIRFVYGGKSVMPYTVSQLNSHLLDAFDAASDKYSFLPKMYSRLKPIALSELMSYTHITGIYTYYTGEANINVAFPDYTLPFTAAHELAHQRGILPENEANFVAFLVCMESDEPYIRYSGYLNILEYLNSALYAADRELYYGIQREFDIRTRYEMLSYNEFFKKYTNNPAADISSAVNDTYLKLQGQAAGERSYGMVVDLAVAYVMSMEN